jgi:hypothetical protein
LIFDRSIHSKLRNRLIESFLYASESNFYEKKIFFNNMKLMFKEAEELNIINFIFDIFTRYSKSGQMNQSEIQDVYSVFKK